MKNSLNVFNCGRRSQKDEVREGPSKTAVVSERIVGVCELIMQDRHVTYHKIQPFFPPAYVQYFINTWPLKRFVLVVFRTIWRSLKKRFVSIGVKKCWKTTMAVPQKTFIKSSQKSWIYAYEPETKQQFSVWIFQPCSS